jgi:ABC-type multidrug transport system fused ATPase/permease subunit
MLVRACQLYLIDDLSSALDDETERAIWRSIDAGRGTERATYLVVSHRLAALRRADQLVMKAGRIVQQGTLASLSGTSETIHRILYSAGGHA